jgi:hypothetical protein
MLSNFFKWKHFVGEIILLNVRWYLKYPLSYRNLKEMMIERGINVDHTTIMRWVHQYSPEIEKKVRRYLRPTNDFWRMDETYIRVKGEWKYLYRAVDSNGNTIDFMLSAKRNKKAAKRFRDLQLKTLFKSFVQFLNPTNAFTHRSILSLLYFPIKPFQNCLILRSISLNNRSIALLGPKETTVYLLKPTTRRAQ